MPSADRTAILRGHLYPAESIRRDSGLRVLSAGAVCCAECDRQDASRLCVWTQDFQISGGPKWIDSERFDIIGKEDESISAARQKLPWKQYREQLGLMVQAMLADRFQLKVAHQPREASILALMIAPGGSKLVGSERKGYEADFRGGRGRLTATGVSIAQLADALSWMPEVNSRKVVDETGIEGTFDLTLRWSWETSPDGGGPVETVQPDAPTMFTAVREQLGLRFQAKQGQLDYVVVEKVEHPSEN